MRKSVLALLGSSVRSAATIPDDLVACLLNDAGCTVTSIEGETGTLETPHPYSNNGLYIFQVNPPADSPEGKAYKVTFDEFEVDGNADGDCHDEVWIMDSVGTPLAGPFCGFDDAFSVGMVPSLPEGENRADSEDYDYYYEQLLNSHNLGAMAGDGQFFTAPLVVGFKTDRTVPNYGFKLNYDLSGCQPGYQIQDDGSCSIVFDELTNKIPAGLPGCGATATTVPVPSGDGRIDGGSSATRGSWPWLVRIKIASPTMDQCSGTILDNETVLTTARCCHAAGEVKKMRVFVGEHDQRSNAEEGEFQVDPISFVSHPEYNADGNSFADRAHDHCILKIPNLENNKNPECDGCFTSICLPSDAYQPGRACWTAGWGALHSESNQKSAKLRSVGINIMPWDYCEANSNYMFFQLSKDAEFCAGMPDHDENAVTDGGVGPCNGDQGSPLVCDDDGHAVLYGQYSWATECGVEGYPAIYADVFPELDWIASQMGAEDPTGPADPVWDEITSNEITPGLTCTNPDAGRIFNGGSVASIDDWGFLVHFSSAKRLDDGSMDWTQGVDCAGTIVDDEWVITSEECCMKLIENVECDYTDITMAFMDPNTKNPDENQFYQQPNDFRFQNGVCLMRTEPLNWSRADGSTNEYSYACLPDSHNVPAGTKCWTAGWGETSAKGNFSNKLRSLALNVFDNEWCAAKSAYESVDDLKFCAGRPNNSGGIAPQYDTCQRDLGGPLICDVNGSPVVYGVLSSGNECDQPDIRANPSLFTRLGDADTRSWISEVLNEPQQTTTTPAPPECVFETPVPVDWMTGSKTSKMWRKGPNSLMVRYRNFRNQASFNFRNKEYIGFLTFRKDKCGQDFLDAWTDGRIFHYTIYDAGNYYDFGNSTPFYFENDSDSTVTIQYRQIKAMISKNLPKNHQKNDDVYFAISGTDSVNWGTKDPEACLVGAKNGVMKMPDFDESGELDYASCVGKEMTWKNRKL